LERVCVTLTSFKKALPSYNNRAGNNSIIITIISSLALRDEPSLMAFENKEEHIRTRGRGTKRNILGPEEEEHITTRGKGTKRNILGPEEEEQRGTY
jgi:hypothetical protein